MKGNFLQQKYTSGQQLQIFKFVPRSCLAVVSILSQFGPLVYVWCCLLKKECTRQPKNNNKFFSSFLEGDTLDSIASSDLTIDSEIDMENDPPAIRVRNAIKEIEERRTAKLHHMRVIGNVTYKKPNFASELVHNVRRVNFKWQLGNKIGMIA